MQGFCLISDQQGWSSALNCSWAESHRRLALNFQLQPSRMINPNLPPHRHSTRHTMISQRPRSEKIRIEPAAEPKNLAALKRLNSLLLPINYRESFYSDIRNNPTDGALSRVAFWESGINIVGGIRARWDPPTELDHTLHPEGSRGGSVYLMTICVLSPFRQLGIASALLEDIMETAKQWRVDQVYAHVWEENHDALDWYRKKGFTVDEGVVESYYRKLSPAGAKIVRLKIVG